MKLLLCLLLTGCAQTSVTTKYFTMRTQANMRNFTATETTFHVDEINHSTPTLAGGKAIGGASTAIGSAAAGLGTVLLAH